VNDNYTRGFGTQVSPRKVAPVHIRLGYSDNRGVEEVVE
jgi:hypothetical protein